MPESTPKPDDLLRLEDAAKLGFPHIHMTASGLRTEAKKGRLALYRVAGKDFTTLADIERMKEKCRIQERASASTSREQGATAKASSLNAACGAFETDASKSALDSARARLTTLRNSKTPLPTTSRPSGKSHATATVIHLKS